MLPIRKIPYVLGNLDREIDEEDVQDYAASPDFSQQLFNVLAQKTRGHPFQTVKSMSEEEEVCGAGAGVKTLAC